MKKITSLTIVLLCIVTLSSFVITKKELVGTWRWLNIVNSQSGEKIDIQKMTMGMAKEMKMEFKDDNSYLEHKTNSEDGKISTTSGEWKLEVEGTVLNMKTNEKWRPSKIISFSSDTLIIEMRGPMHLVLVKEK